MGPKVFPPTSSIKMRNCQKNWHMYMYIHARIRKYVRGVISHDLDFAFARCTFGNWACTACDRFGCTCSDRLVGWLVGWLDTGQVGKCFQKTILACSFVPFSSSNFVNWFKLVGVESLDLLSELGSYPHISPSILCNVALIQNLFSRYLTASEFLLCSADSVCRLDCQVETQIYSW